MDSCEVLTLTDTVLFDDCSKYVYQMPHIEEKDINTQHLRKASKFTLPI